MVRRFELDSVCGRHRFRAPLVEKQTNNGVFYPPYLKKSAICNIPQKDETATNSPKHQFHEHELLFPEYVRSKAASFQLNECLPKDLSVLPYCCSFDCLHRAPEFVVKGLTKC
jgi:hypothetical protein